MTYRTKHECGIVSDLHPILTVGALFEYGSSFNNARRGASSVSVSREVVAEAVGRI